jgi:hypothetical protein
MSIGNVGIGRTLHVVDMVILFVVYCYRVDQFTDINLVILLHGCGPGSVVGYSDWLRAGRSGGRIPVEARFSAPVQTSPGAHSASCTKGTGSFPGVKSGRGLTLTPHPLLVPWSRKARAIPLPSLWAVRSVQSLSACTRVPFTLYFTSWLPSLP